MTSDSVDPEELFEAGVETLQQEDFLTAAVLLAEAEEIFVANGKLRSAAVSALNRASALEDLGRFTEALDVLTQAEGRAAGAIEPMLRAEFDLLGGLLLESLEDYQAALSRCQSAQRGFLGSGDELNAAIATVNLAGTYESAGLANDALKEYRAAADVFASLALFEQRDEVLDRISTLLTRGD